MEILSYLIPRKDSTFTLPNITFEQCFEIIQGLKSSNSVGYDSLNSKIIKIIGDIITPYLTHLINCSINEGKFPKALKISRILPLVKPNKNPTKLSSLRPISNLHIFDKCMEEWIRSNLIAYLNQYNILHPNHHGGLSNCSTITAKAQIEHIVYVSLF